MPHFASFVAIVILMLSCSKEEPSKIDPDSDHLKYFGFTLIDTWWDDPTDDEVKVNYIDEVATFSNVADILVVNPTDNIVKRMQRMDGVQVKCILSFFFEQVSTASPSGVEYKLRPDYKNRWDEFVRVNEMPTNKNLVQAFYMGEEPT